MLAACAGIVAVGAAQAQNIKPQPANPVAQQFPGAIDRTLVSGDPTLFEHVPLLSFTKSGVLLNQPNFSPDAPPITSHDSDPTRGPGCSTTVTYSGADFNGGAYTVQAGMAQGESAAVTFVVPAAQFPVVIRTTECIWATQNAVVPTTTRYGVLWYSGNPQTGTLITGFESDGVILPNISLPIGSSAVNVQVTIDNQDPEQVVIPAPADGSNTITVEVRIVQHNSPSSSPCTVATPTNRNAFPTTDTNGLAQAARNWLYGLNCGPFGCPANGGWSTFAALPGFCRPSGDWNIRLTYEPQTCVPATGACCAPTGACTVVTSAQCTSSGGTYRGDNSTCAQANCPTPTQACCFSSNQSCVDLTPSNCTGFGGVPGGFGTFCSTYVCFPVGACCLPNGTCQDNTTPASCSGQGGTFKGNATVCASQNCPQPTGACCAGTGFCAELLQTQCTQVGGSWKGPLTTCADNNSNGTADLCEQQPCTGDINGDHARNTADLTVLLGHFGQNVTPNTNGDLNGSGTVTTVDLTALLGVFGVPCP